MQQSFSYKKNNPYDHCASFGVKNSRTGRGGEILLGQPVQMKIAFYCEQEGLIAFRWFKFGILSMFYQTCPKSASCGPCHRAPIPFSQFADPQSQHVIQETDLGSSNKVSAIWGWMIFGWAINNSAMTFWGDEK